MKKHQAEDEKYFYNMIWAQEARCMKQSCGSDPFTVDVLSKTVRFFKKKKKKEKDLKKNPWFSIVSSYFYACFVLF